MGDITLIKLSELSDHEFRLVVEPRYKSIKYKLRTEELIQSEKKIEDKVITELKIAKKPLEELKIAKKPLEEIKINVTEEALEEINVTEEPYVNLIKISNRVEFYDLHPAPKFYSNVDEYDSKHGRGLKFYYIVYVVQKVHYADLLQILLNKRGYFVCNDGYLYEIKDGLINKAKVGNKLQKWKAVINTNIP